MVNKVILSDKGHANLMFGPDQAAISKAVLNNVQDRLIPKTIVDKILIVISVFIHSNAKNREGIYANNYEATKLVVRNAMNKTPTVQELITEKNTLNTVNVIYHIKITAILYCDMRKTFLKLAPLLDYCVTLTSRNEELK